MKKLIIALALLGVAGTAQAYPVAGQTAGTTKYTTTAFGGGDSLISQSNLMETDVVVTDVAPLQGPPGPSDNAPLAAGFIHDYVFIAIQNTFISIASVVQLSGSQAGTFISPLALQVFLIDGVDTLLGASDVTSDGDDLTRSAAINVELVQGETYVVRVTSEGGTALGSDPNYTLKVISAVPVNPTVTIDIKPGSDPNSVNPRSKGVVPVAVLGSTDFDATQIDYSTVTFGPDGASPAHDGHVEDVNDDGYPDMVFHFKTRDTGIICGDTKATLMGDTFDGLSVTGTDTVKTVGCK